MSESNQTKRYKIPYNLKDRKSWNGIWFVIISISKKIRQRFDSKNLIFFHEERLENCVKTDLGSFINDATELPEVKGRVGQIFCDDSTKASTKQCVEEGMGDKNCQKSCDAIYGQGGQIMLLYYLFDLFLNLPLKSHCLLQSDEWEVWRRCKEGENR